jgi:hypothetical protein
MKVHLERHQVDAKLGVVRAWGAQAVTKKTIQFCHGRRSRDGRATRFGNGRQGANRSGVAESAEVPDSAAGLNDGMSRGASP